MKKQLILSIIPILGFLALSASLMDDNGKAGATGSPGETTCNTSNCHNSFALNSGGGSVNATSTMVNWQYEPLTTYSISIKVARSGNSLFGVGAEILTNANTNAGNIIITDAVHTQTKNATIGGVSRKSVVHKLNGGASQDSMIFTFNWTSPDTTAGNLTLYYAGNATNASGTPAGDYVYTGSHLITPASGTGLERIDGDYAFRVFPNPAKQTINVHYTAWKNEPAEISLFDLGGRCLLSFPVLGGAGEHLEKLTLPANLSPGTYFISFKTPTEGHSKKILVR